MKKCSAIPLIFLSGIILIGLMFSPQIAKADIENYAGVIYYHSNGETVSPDEEYEDGSPVILPIISNTVVAIYTQCTFTLTKYARNLPRSSGEGESSPVSVNAVSGDTIEFTIHWNVKWIGTDSVTSVIINDVVDTESLEWIEWLQWVNDTNPDSNCADDSSTNVSLLYNSPAHTVNFESNNIKQQEIVGEEKATKPYWFKFRTKVK